MSEPEMSASDFKKQLLEVIENLTEDSEIFIECTICKKWRKVSGYSTGDLVPEHWECSMQENGNCSIPSPYDDSDLMEYDPGQIVWAKLSGYPWWPGMIDLSTHCNIIRKPNEVRHRVKILVFSHKYHVRFFGKHVLKQWVDQRQICFYSKNSPDQILGEKRGLYKDLERAILQAEKAQKMNLQDRLKKYSFGLCHSDDDSKKVAETNAKGTEGKEIK
ncbi:zinc finger CW-type PWWP domain protein 1 [Trichonephila inaurata madagascariensis]|uniref:Zinc finger CW-type PWWP domain protein 1 n=1 Tax=Trichonephila inaurata madagascariensis TaxID=2747483 RepID=A0A8X6JZA9_9ARAC|nr:zinc finger CW-type PWWP domain protein 1 [Trichonephila inaurata madagascariensis]